MRHIFLYGPPGSGKSTVGKALASRLQMRFVDLDQAIHSKTGKPITQIMEDSGESGFRDLEGAVLREELAGTEAVIALGGGTLLRAKNRKLAEANGKVICLKADPRILLERLAADCEPRPLLAGDMAQQLARLLAGRAEHYDSFNTQLNSDQSVQELCEQMQTAIGRFHLTAMASYDVIIEDGCIGHFGEMLKVRGVRDVAVVSDENVMNLHSEAVVGSLRGSGYDARVLAIPAGESSKTVESVGQLWHGFLEAGLDRRSTVIALGGGVVSDLAGFAASTYMRGINWVCVPTTVLSMVDASIGGKTGFDLPEGKNLVGSFHAPQLVLADPQVLGTLPEAEFRAGLAEMVKHGVVADPELFHACAGGLASVKERLVDLIRRAVAAKIGIIESDPYETGPRAALNFGHTIGHAAELVTGFRISHGEAVAIGMVAESKLAERLSIARRGLSDEIAAVLSTLGLPVRIPDQLPRPALIRAMHNDKKKAGGKVRFALPADIGRMQLNVEVADLQSILED